jgi:hypothetical protein
VNLSTSIGSKRNFWFYIAIPVAFISALIESSRTNLSLLETIQLLFGVIGILILFIEIMLSRKHITNEQAHAPSYRPFIFSTASKISLIFVGTYFLIELFISK